MEEGPNSKYCFRKSLYLLCVIQYLPGMRSQNYFVPAILLQGWNKKKLHPFRLPCLSVRRQNTMHGKTMKEKAR